MDGFRYDEGHDTPKRINMFDFDNVGTEADDNDGGEGLMRWLAAAVLVFVAALVAFAALVAWCWTK